MVLAFDETKAIVPELAAQGWDMSKTYYTDGNLYDYSEDFEPGHPRGRPGHPPRRRPRRGLQGAAQRLVRVRPRARTLKDFSYGAESYDAVILAALAAVKGGEPLGDGAEELRRRLRRHRRRGVHDLRRLCRPARGRPEIPYAGPSGIGPINDENDPSSAFIGIYQYDADNKTGLTSTLEGSESVN